METANIVSEWPEPFLIIPLWDMSRLKNVYAAIRTSSVTALDLTTVALFIFSSEVLLQCHYRDWTGSVCHLCHFELLLPALRHAQVA